MTNKPPGDYGHFLTFGRIDNGNITLPSLAGVPEHHRRTIAQHSVVSALHFGSAQRSGPVSKPSGPVRFPGCPGHQNRAWYFNCFDAGTRNSPRVTRAARSVSRTTNSRCEVGKKGLTVITDKNGHPVRYRTVAEELSDVKATMNHPDAARHVTHGLRKNATIELYQSGCDDEMVKAVTGHSGVEMLKIYGGQIRQRELATRAQDARNRFEQNRKET